jgi:hypothetical protein
VSIAVIAVSFLAMVAVSVGVTADTNWFVVLLAIFSILVIALAPWVLGN